MELVRLTKPIDPLAVLDVLLARPDLWVTIPVLPAASQGEYFEKLWHTVQFAPAIRSRVTLEAATEADLLGYWTLIALEKIPVVSDAQLPPRVWVIDPDDVSAETATEGELYALAGMLMPAAVDESEGADE